MDKENGSKSNEGNSGSSSKISNSSTDPGSLLDAASLFGAYWPRGDANTASLFAAAGGGFGLPPHPSLPFGLLPPTSGRALPTYPTSTAAAAAYSNAYTNTLSVAASQAASLGIPAASAAWWSMASHLAAQDYLARLQASGLNFPGICSPTDLQYAASLGLPSSTLSSHHKSSKSSTNKNSSSSSSSSPSSLSTKSLSGNSGGVKEKSQSSLNKSNSSLSVNNNVNSNTNNKLSGSSSLTSTSSSSSLATTISTSSGAKYSTSSGLTIQPSGMKLPSTQTGINNNNNNTTNSDKKKVNDYTKQQNSKVNSNNIINNNNNSNNNNNNSGRLTSSPLSTPSSSPSIFTNPLSLVSNFDKSSLNTTSSVDGVPSNVLPSNSILSAALEGNGDPNLLLGGVRLPPDTEIIKYTSSIVGPKIPGTTNRGRKKTISLDPPSVSVHPSHSSTGMLIERSCKRPKLDDEENLTSTPPPPPTSSSTPQSSTQQTNGNINDRIEVIKLQATNGSPSGISVPLFNNNTTTGIGSVGGGDTPLNLSLKPNLSNNSGNSSSSSLNSLSNMSANIGVDRISRRKPGPKPRRVIPSTSSQLTNSPLSQLFATADSPRPPSRNDNSDGGSSTSSSTCAPVTIQTTTTTTTTTTSSTTTTIPITNHKEGRPRNLGRGVSKPKKNTVASLLAQSRALGIKPMPILDPNASMNQQMNLLKSNILAAQQYISEAGGDEKALNKFLQEKFRGALSDSSTVDASTDSDNNLTDSNQTDSEMEIEIANKKQKQYDERTLRIPLEKGWKRETIIRGLTKSGCIKGDVTYIAPESTNKFKQMSDITQYLEYQKNNELAKDNFTFSCRVILGDYLQPIPPEMIPPDGSEFIYLSEDDVIKRLEELKTAMRTNLPVEQRIEMARKQQAARVAARLDREQARLAKEIERSERQEAARRDREARSQQLLEGRKRLAFTLEQKIQIISEIEGGKTKSDVSRELGLASSTVATIWKNRDNIINAYSSENIGHNPNNNDCLFSPDNLMAKRKRQEELEKHKQEEQQRKQQEREFKRQQAAILKEQMYIQEMSKQREMLYTVELERERRRQHMALVKSLENRRKLEERERKKQQLLLEKQANKEKKLEQRKIEMEILTELRKPCEDLELDQKPLPEYERIKGLKLCGKAFADILMVFEFLHNFGETLGFDMDSLPTLDSLQQALIPNENFTEAEEELFSVMTHLLVCAIEDPGIPNPARHTTILGQSLKQADITHTNLSEILRIYLYANATGEVKSLNGVHFERDREKRIADHHQNDNEMQQTSIGKNSQYYELLHDNRTWKLSDMLKDKPFMALSPTNKAEILAFICNELLQNKAVIKQIESSLECVAQQKKEKWLLDTKIRKLRMMHNRKIRLEAVEKAQNKLDAIENNDNNVDSPSLHHKDDLLDDDDNDISENESVGTQPEEEEDNKLSSEELGKKLEKLIKTSEIQLQSLNTATHQLRATCFGQDRYWRRYWSLSKAGGIFVESMESADPEALNEQIEFDKKTGGINSLEDFNKIIMNVEAAEGNVIDNTDNEVSNIINKEKLDENNSNEHRKTPNRLDNNLIINNIENGKIIIDKNERNLAELRKSVDDVVQNIAYEKEQEKLKMELQENNNKLDKMESLTNKKFNLFEKLGQCMERENKSEEDLKGDVKAEIKEELKNEILNELKSDIIIKMDNDDNNKNDNNEPKWFSILQKDIYCDGINLTAGNRWDNGGVGACTRDNITELKIPIFPPPNISGGSGGNGGNGSGSGSGNLNSTSINYHNLCDSPAPLQMTQEESLQLEHIKKHGMPKSCPRKSVPLDKRFGWWRIINLKQLKEILDNLHVRGVRERELKRNFTNIMQTMYENQDKLYIEQGNKDLTELTTIDGIENIKFMDGGAPYPDPIGSWSKSIAHRVDLFLLEQVEALEDKVASASMQVKGWKLPLRDGPDIEANQVVSIVKERLSSLEQNIERRYLKPPLGTKPSCINISSGNEYSSTTTITTATSTTTTSTAITSTTTSSSSSSSQQENNENSLMNNSNNGSNTTLNHLSSSSNLTSQQQQQQHNNNDPNEIPKGLTIWREAVNRAQTSAQLAMCLYSLESSIAWDKSIMKANCQFCHSGDNEDKLLLCDGCDKGYHTYCFKPKMDNIPDGDWYCHECMNKATGEKNCIVCGKKSSTSGSKLIICELCPRAYHTDCIQPNFPKAPRGKWYCSKCISKKPQKKTVKKTKQARDSESSDHQPSSPAPSHSSVTTNEDQPTINQSDVSNSSSANASSPSTHTNTTTTATASAATATTSSNSTVTPSTSNTKKERISKKLIKELAPCKAILEDLECHDDAWPFLLPVNTKQFPTYKKIIKNPMDLSTIKKKLYDVSYKSKEEFCLDVRQIFNNCEVFNEDDSPVGKAGHCMRQYFEARWSELTLSHS